MAQQKYSYIEHLYMLHNAIIGDNFIQNAKITNISENGILQTHIDVKSDKYKIYTNILTNVSDKKPSFNIQTILTDVLSFKELQYNMQQFFHKKHIFFPSLSKFEGNASVIIKNSTFFGKPFHF